MARRSAYSTVFASCDIARPDMPVSPRSGLRFDWGRVTAVALCLMFWAGVAAITSAALG
jgi:hypothetical protein